MGNLLTLKFWFSLRPGAPTPLALKIFLALIIFLLVAAIAFKIAAIIYRKSLYRGIWLKFSSFSLTNGILGMILLFLFYEQVYFLAARFWFIVWLVSMGVWKYFIFKRILKIPEEREKWKKEMEYRKYIP